MDWWHQISQLKGRKFKTLKQGKTFTLISVTQADLYVRVDSSAKERHIARHEIESAYEELRARGELPFADIRGHKHSEANPAYVAALLAALPNVTYTTDPIQLRFKPNWLCKRN